MIDKLCDASYYRSIKIFMEGKNMNFKKLSASWRKMLAFTLAGALLIGSSLATQAATLKDVFDAKYYSETYSDLNAAFGTNAQMLKKHYQTYGIKEGRTGNALIDVKKYREAYADLNAAFGDNWDAYLNHYLTYGVKEGRNSFGSFDAKAYADRYADLKAAFGYDVLALYKHYIQYGRAEGRNAAANVVAAASSSCGSSNPGSGVTVPDYATTPVTTSGVLRDPETGAPIPNARLTFTRVSDIFEELAEVASVTGGDAAGDTASGNIAPGVSSGDGWYVVVTDENGNYVIPDFAAGVYTVIAEAPNYMTLTLNSITIASEAGSFSMPTFEMLSADGSGSNLVAGTAIDASTGLTIADVTINIRAGWNTYTGEILNTITTDESGHYSVMLDRGYYTLEFSLDNYTSVFVNVASSNAVGTVNGTLSSTSEVLSDQCRVVLTWNESPRDLDSHLVGASDAETAGYFHVYYGDKVARDAEGEVAASLDVDDTSSYGPETVTIINVDPNNNYYYSVHDFTNRSTVDSAAMAASGANVKVYMGSALVREYNVPTNGLGFVWNVFMIDHGRLVDLNWYGSNYDTIYGEYGNAPLG